MNMNRKHTPSTQMKRLLTIRKSIIGVKDSPERKEKSSYESHYLLRIGPTVRAFLLEPHKGVKNYHTAKVMVQSTIQICTHC